MRTIELANEHRRKHFEFFRQMNHPHFSITAPVDVTGWVAETKKQGLRMTASLLYLLTAAANAIPQFRWRLREDEIIEHDRVHPSMTVRTRDTDVFSFCEVEFGSDFRTFVERAHDEIEARRTEPSLEDLPGRDDYLFMSALPWVAFTSMNHAMSYHPHDSVPRIVWGKLHMSGDRLLMPVDIQAHHALVDGVHMAAVFQKIEDMARTPQSFMG